MKNWDHFLVPSWTSRNFWFPQIYVKTSQRFRTTHPSQNWYCIRTIPDSVLKQNNESAGFLAVRVTVRGKSWPFTTAVMNSTSKLVPHAHTNRGVRPCVKLGGYYKFRYNTRGFTRIRAQPMCSFVDAFGVMVRIAPARPATPPTSLSEKCTLFCFLNCGF